MTPKGSHLPTNGGGQSREDRIKQWLSCEWTVTDLENEIIPWSFEVTTDNNPGVIVMQSQVYPDQVVIKRTVAIDAVRQAALRKRSALERSDLLWEMRIGLLNLRVEFYGIAEPLEEVTIFAAIYDDGLTKDALLQRVGQVSKGVMLVAWTLERRLPEVSDEFSFEDPSVS
jgi:hypothetical protein